MGRSRLALAVAVTFALAMATAQGATAATTVGTTDLVTSNPPGVGCSSGCVYIETAPGLKIPFNGVIVRWRVKLTSVAGGGSSPRLRVVRRAAGNITAVGASAPEPVSSAGIKDFPTTIPVRAGDLLAFEFSGETLATRHPPDNPGIFFTSGLKQGDTQPESAAGSPSVVGELLLNADVEPDDDLDGLGDETQDGDDDNDGVLDGSDNCALAPDASQLDTDSDGKGDVCDDDDDQDGVSDATERLRGTDPLRADSDSDGARDDADNCPLVASADQRDTDGDGLGDACDPDDDNDGLSDAVEALPPPSLVIKAPKAVKRSLLRRKGIRVRVGSAQPVTLAIELRAGRSVIGERSAGPSSGDRAFTLKGKTKSRRIQLRILATNPAGKRTLVRRTVRVR